MRRTRSALARTRKGCIDCDKMADLKSVLFVKAICRDSDREKDKERSRKDKDRARDREDRDKDCERREER